VNRRHLLGTGLLGLAAAGLGACSVLPERPYVETRRFPLVARRSAAPRGPGGKVLLVRLMRAAPGLDQRGLRSIRADGTESVDFYNEWTAPPAELAEELVRRWFLDSGLFAGVVAPGTRARADLVLEAELSQLVADLRQNEARAAISGIVLQEGGSEAGRVLGQFAPAGRAPLPAAGKEPPAPAVLATAMGNALAVALTGLEDSVARFA
jgi:cholesterol transport system auxiliary component